MKKLSLLFLSSIFLFASCASDDDVVTEVENEQELITTVIVELISDSDDVDLSWEDLDAEDDADPEITGGTLLPNTTYTGYIELLNENAEEEDHDEEEEEEEEEGHEHDHGYDVTEEIEEEAEDHQFFFTTTGDLDVTINYVDEDANGNPIGLEFTLVTGDVSEGELEVLLLHEPDKFAEGVSEGDATNAGGEVDIDVSFPITIAYPEAIAVE